MKRKSLFSMFLTAALGLVMATPANADFATRTWKSTSSTNFSLAANWNPEDVPDTVHEEAIIPDLSGSLVIPVMTQAETVGGVEIQAQGTLKTGAYTLTIQASAGHGDGIMTIASGGELNIQTSGRVNLVSDVIHPVTGVLNVDASATLDIQDGRVNLLGNVTHPISGVLDVDASAILDIQDGTVHMDSANTHPIGGDILLSGSGSTLKVSATTTLARNGANKGSVKGQHNDAQVLIDEPCSGTNTLTSNIIFEGNMTVARGVAAAGTAKFLNGSTGIVRANADGTAEDKAILLLAAGLTIDDADTGTPKWEATTDPDAVLQFNVGAACLDGAFLIDGCATLKLDGVTIKTKGDVTKTAGEIVLANGAALFKDLASDCTGGTSVSAGTFGSCP